MMSLQDQYMLCPPLACCTSAAQDLYIWALHRRNRTVTARETSSNVPGRRQISAQTVRNRLRENGLCAIAFR